MARDAGERHHFERVEVGVVLPDGATPRTHKAGDVSVREGSSQTSQRRGSKEQVAQMVGADHQNALYRTRRLRSRRRTSQKAWVGEPE